MIDFYYETKFALEDEGAISSWISKIIVSENKKEGEITYVFCDDEYLLKLNQEFLNHDTYTDIISFDNTIGNELSGDIFISVDRVKENAVEFSVPDAEEMRRVIAHGVLHFCGYKDKTLDDEKIMRKKEEEKLAMFHVEHN